MRNRVTSTECSSIAALPRIATITAAAKRQRRARCASSTISSRWRQASSSHPRTRFAWIDPFEPHRVNSIFFIQGAADGASHTLILDELRIDTNQTGNRALTLPPVRKLQAKAYERHIDVTWQPVDSAALARYIIYRAL